MVCSLTHGYTKIVKLFLLSFQIFFVFFLCIYTYVWILFYVWPYLKC